MKDSLRLLKSLMLLAVMLFSGFFMNAQEMPTLPVDPEVRVGTLPNGLTYYIRHNEKQPGLADFYIAQKVGSINEEDNQRGLAHFLEHMCFNGTTNFPGNSLINWLETVGVKFGRNLNAYTSIDETVYNISDVPVTRTSVQDSCLLILHDWANELLLEPEEIDKERGVIHEEWRSRNSGQQRILTEILPSIYPTSKYAYRMPIGTMEIVDNFPPQDLRDYYEKWYRPDLQGLVIVGDIDVDYIEGKIREMFSDIPKAVNPAERVYVPVPNHEGTLYGIGKDPEQTNNIVEFMWISDPMPDEMRNTPYYYVNKYIERMITGMLNQRFSDMAMKPDAPFAVAGCNFDGFFLSTRTKDCFEVYVMPKEQDVYPAFEAAYREVLRAARHGFTESEYERAVADYRAGWDQAYNNRDSRDNDELVNEYVRSFLDAEPIPGIDIEYMLSQQLPMMISLDDINEVFKEVPTENNRVVIAMLADKEGLVMPDADGFNAIYAKVEGEDIEAFAEEVKDEPLIENLRPAGTVVSTTTDPQWDATVWTLSNGLKVVVKKTDYKADEVLFEAQAFGGTADLPSEYDADIMFLGTAVSDYSLGTYTHSDLRKYLAGKQVGVSVDFDEYLRTIDGTSTPKDLETMLELVYMMFMDSKVNPDEFASNQNTMTSLLRHQIGTPDWVFSETLMSTLFKSPRNSMLTPEIIAQATPEKTTEVMQRMVANPADYTFYFVGNVDLDALKPLVEKYIASLPTDPATAQTTMVPFNPDFFVTPGQHNVVRTTSMETPTTYAAVIESGHLPYTAKDQKLAQVAGQILTNRLLKTVREDWGAVYSISASGSLSRIGTSNATLQSVFPVKPEMKDQVFDFVAEQIKAMESDITEDELAPVIEYMVKNVKDNLNRNETWLGAITAADINGVDTFNGSIELLQGLTVADVMDYMKRLNAEGNYAIIAVDPEAAAE